MGSRPTSHCLICPWSLVVRRGWENCIPNGSRSAFYNIFIAILFFPQIGLSRWTLVRACVCISERVTNLVDPSCNTVLADLLPCPGVVLHFDPGRKQTVLDPLTRSARSLICPWRVYNFSAPLSYNVPLAVACPSFV